LEVEYSLSEKGISFIPIINAMCDWGKSQTTTSSGGLLYA